MGRDLEKTGLTWRKVVYCWRKEIKSYPQHHSTTPTVATSAAAAGSGGRRGLEKQSCHAEKAANRHLNLPRTHVTLICATRARSAGGGGLHSEARARAGGRQTEALRLGRLCSTPALLYAGPPYGTDRGTDAESWACGNAPMVLLT